MQMSVARVSLLQSESVDSIVHAANNKLSIGAENDPYEREADAMADRVMRMPEAPFVQRKCAGCEEEEQVQRKPLAAEMTPFIQRKGGEGGVVSDAVSAQIESSQGSGSPLPATTRTFMESRFGTDFSGVKIHAGNDAVQMSRELNAQAFTVGSDIYFNSGKFAPESESGRHLLSHELTHTIQQSGINNSLYSKRIQRVGMGDVQLAEQRKQANAKTLQLVTEGEKDWIKEVLKKNGIPEGTPQNLQNTKFLLHDTSSPVSETSINREATKKGPYGAGVAAYVPREGPADPANPGDYYEKHITRPDFYETKRPSTSEFEKGIDLITQADREAAVKLAWSATKEAEKEPAIDLALSDTGLSAADIAILKKGVKDYLAGGKPIDGAKTTSVWAVGELCKKGSSVVAEPTKIVEFDDACKKLETYFKVRPQRVGSIVPVEIVQVGAKDPKGNQNTCDPKNTNTMPFKSPPYSDAQYQFIAYLYLRAAFISGYYPEVTTHFVVDSFEKGHCDPRCFDLQKLYDTIADILSHGKGSTYGVVPTYGLTWGTDSIWWDNTICGSNPP